MKSKRRQREKNQRPLTPERKLWNEVVVRGFNAPDTLRQFIRDNPNALETRGFGDETPMHYLAVERQFEAVQILLDLGAQTRGHQKQAADGETYWISPLSDILGEPRLVEALMKAGADPHERDLCYDSPMHRAASDRQIQSLKCMMNHGGDLTFRHPDDGTQTPVILTLVTNMKPRQMDEVQAIVNLQPDCLECSIFDETLLTHAAAYESPVIVTRLLTLGADPNRPNNDACTPLINAIKFCCGYGGGPDAIQSLLAAGADPNLVVDGDDISAMHAAAQQNDAISLDMLITAGGDLYLKSGSHPTPFEILEDHAPDP